MVNYTYGFFGCSSRNYKQKRIAKKKKSKIMVDERISVYNNILHILIYINVFIIKFPF